MNDQFYSQLAGKFSFDDLHKLAVEHLGLTRIQISNITAGERTPHDKNFAVVRRYAANHTPQQMCDTFALAEERGLVERGTAKKMREHLEVPDPFSIQATTPVPVAALEACTYPNAVQVAPQPPGQLDGGGPVVQTSDENATSAMEFY